MPPLAWIAIRQKDSNVVTVIHGARVETRERWFCEGVWDGPFEEAGFDATPTFFGSGAKCVSDGVRFVSSCATVDRLQYIQREEDVAISNSLACLFAYGALKPDYGKDYYTQFSQIVDGSLSHQIVAYPTSVQLVYVKNLHLTESTIRKKRKPKIPEIRSFQDYDKLLQGAVGNFLDNARSCQRARPLEPIGTLSSGYDSTAVTSILAQHGLERAVTITRARGGETDSGAEAAEALNLYLHHIRRNAWRKETYPEPLFVAADAKGEDVYFSGLPSSLLEGSVFFTAYHGDVVWGAKPYRPFQRGDRSGLSLTEYRLVKGFIHVPVPFIGCSQVEVLQRISASDAMSNWDVGGSYSRPIPRRIAEERGVPRSAFGIKKKAASVLFQQPEISPWTVLSSRSYIDFIRWLWQKSKSGHLARCPLEVSTLLLRQTTLGVIARAGTSIAQRLPPKLGRFWQGVNRLYSWGGQQSTTKHLFPWALEYVVNTYYDLDPQD